MFKVAVLSDSMAVSNSDLKNNPTSFIHGNNLQHAKPSAPYKVSELFREHGYTSTVFNYFSQWDQQDIIDTLVKYSEGYPLLIAFSVTLNNGDSYLKRLADFTKLIKEHIPGTITILGGIRNFENTDRYTDIGDVLYIGRSIPLLMKDIHNRLFDELINKKFDTMVMRYPDNENRMDDPVIHKFYKNDTWLPHDVPIFETSIGCKFNCTFCNYDFRNIKNPKMSAIDSLVEFFNNANSFGITNFYSADDTINETDEKIDTLHQAVKELDFTPTIASFARQDVLYNKPDRIEKMSEAGLTSLFFGIETVNYEANKLIRKGSSPERILETLKQIKSVNPNFFLFSGMIIGLTHDSENSIRHYNDVMLSERLLDGLSYMPLRIMEDETMWDWQSEIDKNPEKYGYKIKKGASKKRAFRSSDNAFWSNDWTDYAGAQQLRDDLFEHNLQRFGYNSMVGNWAYTCLKALGVVDDVVTWPDKFKDNIGYKPVHTLMNSPVDKAIQQYIQTKKDEQN
jgi:hypothetical protein